MITEKS